MAVLSRKSKYGLKALLGRLTIFGDMSATLCRNGEFEAAQALERMWDEITRALPFSTVYSYPTNCLEHSEARGLLANVCAAHRSLLPELRATSTEVAI